MYDPGLRIFFVSLRAICDPVPRTFCDLKVMHDPSGAKVWLIQSLILSLESSVLTLFCIGIIRFFTLSQRLLYAYKSGVVDLGAIILYYLMLFKSKSIGRPPVLSMGRKKAGSCSNKYLFFLTPC